MRWFRHLADAHRDDDLIRVMDRHGLAGYARYFIILEVIARQMSAGDAHEATFPWRHWEFVLRGRRKQIRELLRDLVVVNLSYTEVDGDLTISAPNLMKYRDQYTRRPGQIDLIEDFVPFKTKEGLWRPRAVNLEDWYARFPRLDLNAEFTKMRGWLNDNPGKRKSNRGMSAFIGRWLTRANENLPTAATVTRLRTDDMLADPSTRR